jgi:hypothetical protein
MSRQVHGRHTGEVEMYLYSFSTPVTDGGRWSKPLAGHFTRGNDNRYALYSRLCGLQVQSWRVRKFLPPSGLEPRTVQPVASRYNDWGIPGS